MNTTSKLFLIVSFYASIGVCSAFIYCDYGFSLVGNITDKCFHAVKKDAKTGEEFTDVMKAINYCNKL